MMKKLMGAILAMIALSATPAFAQTSANATASGSTTIVTGLSINKNSDLAFGSIMRPTTGTGTVTIGNSADTITASNGAVALSTSPTRAKFIIAGEGGQSVSVGVPASFALTGPNNATITVNLSSDLGSSTTLSNTAGTAGSKNLNVGGSFDLAATQAIGAYSGSFNVTVAYN